jgi:hypothetical protein
MAKDDIISRVALFKQLADEEGTLDNMLDTFKGASFPFSRCFVAHNSKIETNECLSQISMSRSGKE